MICYEEKEFEIRDIINYQSDQILNKCKAYISATSKPMESKKNVKMTGKLHSCNLQITKFYFVLKIGHEFQLCNVGNNDNLWLKKIFLGVPEKFSKKYGLLFPKDHKNRMYLLYKYHLELQTCDLVTGDNIIETFKYASSHFFA